ncbi:U1 small nuclear ribonucleoprotein C, putative [Plasmodium gallinaceum]|uniref:U1 small nuclear ribonucleoprotein C, putative n=1 Tax=Plasmodium gallinaceum TaxID=5849 RepID=A0A1J1GST9_PLAGA|nr:U1 small nuclear ribonucleoprotein C, putative [Plasmodium gallinaceum]CRG95545.1 U1 small nuclear ribonucleoprotein C, putative [Plasmodium gallinaceum]
MTDYWISSKKHYCETCNCWISGHKVNIKNHEKSFRHLENFKRLINESFKRKEKETKEKKFIEEELRKLDNVEKNYLSVLKKNDKLTQLDNSIDLNTVNSSNKDYQKWILMIHEDTGSLVFFDKINNQLTYEKPKDFFEKLPDYQTFSEQNGWFKYFDYNFNNFYYYNINNSEVIWQYSVSTINNFINLIKKYECYDRDKKLNNTRENIKQNITSDYLCNQINLNNNSYYNPYPVNFNQNSHFIYNNFNLLNIQEKINSQKNDNIEMTENKKEKEKIHMIINSYNNSNNNDLKNLDNTSNNNDINNSRRRNNDFLSNSFDKTDENISKMKNKIDEKIEKSKTEIENEKCYNLNQISITNKKNKMDDKMLIDEKQIESNADVEKKKKMIEINFSSKKKNNIFSSTYDKKEKIEDKKKNEKITDFENQHGKSDKCKKNECDETSKPGEWQKVQSNEINTISNECIEDIFYNIKSTEEIEEENIAHLQENIRYEYSTCNEFYVKKKELENEDLYLNQEFRFINKPIYKKNINKNPNKKVEFAKRNIKITKNKKGILK